MYVHLVFVRNSLLYIVRKNLHIYTNHLKLVNRRKINSYFSRSVLKQSLKQIEAVIKNVDTKFQNKQIYCRFGNIISFSFWLVRHAQANWNAYYSGKNNFNRKFFQSNLSALFH